MLSVQRSSTKVDLHASHNRKDCLTATQHFVVDPESIDIEGTECTGGTLAFSSIVSTLIFHDVGTKKKY